MVEHKLTIKFPVFGYNVVVVYTDNIRLSRRDIDNVVGVPKFSIDAATAGLHSYHEDDNKGYIFFTPYSSIGTITHECYHAISRMFRWIGAEHEEEITAYHLAYLLEQILKFKAQNTIKTD